MKPNIAEIKGLSEADRELYRTAFIGAYLPLWQFDLILRAEYDGWAEVERQAEEIKRLREALEFYADTATYDTDHLSRHGFIIIDKDAGDRAREALRGDTQE